MDDIEKLVREIYQDGFVINLGTMDEEGPWVASVTYVFDKDLNIYWVSFPNTRHSQALQKNQKAAGTIVVNQAVGKERALQIEGTAILLDDSSLERERLLAEKRGVAVPSEAGEILKDGRQWYKLTPTRIELIHSELFGYKRKRFL